MSVAVPRQLGSPPLSAQLGEWRWVWELGLYMRERDKLLATCPHGDGRPVMVLPGFLANDSTTSVLRAFLNSLGYKAYGWEQGVNIGPTRSLAVRLYDRVRAIHRSHGRKVSLIGWSLGGIYARELARHSPRQVRMVMTLGSPLRGRATPAWLWNLFRVLNWRNLGEITRARLDARRMALPVRSVALYSRDDGIVGWECCTLPACTRSCNVEVHSSHCGMVYAPNALRAIAEHLRR